jgi:hypothetical protein
VRLAPLTCALALLAGAGSIGRAATRCPAGAGAGPGLAALDGAARLAWIDARLSGTAQRARLWTWGWGIGIGVATVANLAPLPFVAADDRIDWYTGAATTIVGIVPLLIAPLEVIDDARQLHAELTAAPPGDDVCRRLIGAEARLVRDAQNQEDGQRWWLHAGNVALNVGVGLFLGLGFHHWGAGALNAISGSLIGEAIILTQPVGTVDDLRRYRSGALGVGYEGTF